MIGGPIGGKIAVTDALTALDVHDTVSRMRAAIVFFVLIFLAGPADAALSVCNRSGHAVRVALGRFNGAHWSSEGWWFIEPTKCARLIENPLDARYYYLYATNELFGVWDGDRNFCVTVFKRFSIEGRARCESRGYYRLGFFEVDTGSQLDWTQTVSDPR